MSDDEKDLDAVAELLNAEGIADSDFDEEPQEAEEQKDAKPAQPPEDIKELRQQLQQQQNMLQQMMWQMTQQNNNKKAPEPAQEQSDQWTPEERQRIWEMAGKNPELFEALVERQAESIVDKRMKTLEKQLAERFQRDGNGTYLKQQAYDLYGEDIKDPSSEIIKNMAFVKDKISKFLDPTIRGTERENEIALLLSAGLNPKAVSKRLMAREDAENRTREARLRRAAAAAGVGSRGSAQTEDKLTDNDLALFEEYGMDPDDEKTRDYILKAKKTEKMGIMDAGLLRG